MARKNAIKAFDALTNRENFKNPTISCIDGVIFSYRMPIAKLLFNRTIEIVDRRESPSVTTSTHIGGIVELAQTNDYTINTVEKIK